MPARSTAPFRLHSWALFLALSLLALAALAAEPREVGRILVASGEVTAEREGASTRSLGRGDRLYEGDAITTGPGARVQLRLSDEGLVQLDADTEYRIQRYRAEGEERGAVTELVEGGLRTVTGAIGDDDPDDYQLETPVATIGIRGTHFALNHSDKAGTVGEVAQGTIVVENDGGSSEVRAGSFFAVRSRDSAPQSLDQRPAALDSDDGPDEGENEGQEDEGDEAASDDGAGGDEDGDGADDGSALPGDDEGGGDDGLTDEAAETDDDGFLSQTGDAIYSPGEDETTREEVEEEEPTREEVEEEEPTPWYEDDSLTQFGITGSLGYSPPGFVIDGEEHPEEGTIQELSLTADGALKSMTYVEGSMDGETFYGYEYQLVASEGAEPVSRSEHEGLGIHWGRWNLGDYTHEIDGELAFGEETDAPPGTDWHWLVLEDADDLMTQAQYDALSGTATFAWAGGTEIRATNSDLVDEYTYQVDEFSLTANFDNDVFTDGSLRLVTDDGPSDISLDQVGGMEGLEGGGALDATFAVSLQESDGMDSASVMGHFIGEEADGAGVTFSVYTDEDVQGLEGVGALERQ